MSFRPDRAILAQAFLQRRTQVNKLKTKNIFETGKTTKQQKLACQLISVFIENILQGEIILCRPFAPTQSYLVGERGKKRTGINRRKIFLLTNNPGKQWHLRGTCHDVLSPFSCAGNKLSAFRQAKAAACSLDFLFRSLRMRRKTNEL